MPQKSAIFSAARIRVLEKALISEDSMKRLAECDSGSELRLLSEWGYGGADSSSKDIETLIAGELRKCRAVVMDLTSNPKITDAFLMQTDINNLKYLIKMRIQGKEPNVEQLDKNGVFDPKLLVSMVKVGEYPDIPDEIVTVLKQFDEKTTDKPDPQKISVAIDRAYYSYVNSIGDELLTRVFGMDCDIVNVLTLLRLKNLGVDASELSEYLMPQYELSFERLMQAYQADNANMLAVLLGTGKNMKPNTEISDDVKAALTRCLSKNEVDAHAFLRERDNILLQRINSSKSDMDTVWAVVGYMLSKQREAKCIRYITTMKRNGMPSTKILERLRELYG